MRRNRLLFGTILSVLLCFSLLTSAKAETSMWIQTYGGTERNKAFSVVEASDGGYALAGTTGSIETGMDFWLVKTDESGNEQWNQTYGGMGDDVACSLTTTFDGGYAIAGYTDSSVLNYDFWLVKVDEFGNMEWNQTYGGTGNDFAYSVVETLDGGFALAGYWDYEITIFIYPPPFNGDCWLVKTDEFGNMKWSQLYGGERPDGAYSLVATSDGGYALSGGTFVSLYPDPGVDDDNFLFIKTDDNGVVPEASWVILPFLIAATLSIFISKKKLLLKRTQVS